MADLSARSLAGLPEIRAGDDLAALIAGQVDAGTPGRALRDGQVVAIAHKAVSKAEGSVVELAGVRADGASARDRRHAGQGPPRGAGRARPVARDRARRERRPDLSHPSRLRLRQRRRRRLQRAGRRRRRDRSRETAAGGTGAGETLILLPRDPDASARQLRARLRELTGAAPAVLITDSFGRAWRHGQCDVAIGCAGLAPLEDWRGRTDSVGMELRATWIAVADAAAAAADLARAKDSREPVVIVDGLERFVTDDDGPGAGALLRPLGEDLFR